MAQFRVDRDALDRFYRLHVARAADSARRRSRARSSATSRGCSARASASCLLVATGTDGAAAAVFLHHGGMLTYKYGASDPRAWHAPEQPAVLGGHPLGMRARHDALDLGRSDVGQESLRAFKRSWGAEEQVLSTRTSGPIARAPPTEARAGRALATVLRRTPPAASRLVGEILYRHAG